MSPRNIVYVPAGRCLRPCGTLFTSPAGRGLRPCGTAARRWPGDVDHGHALLLVVPAVEPLDARHVDLVGAEEAGDVQRRGLVRLADLRGPLFLLVERLDPDDLPLL